MAGQSRNGWRYLKSTRWWNSNSLSLYCVRKSDRFVSLFTYFRLKDDQIAPVVRVRISCTITVLDVTKDTVHYVRYDEKPDKLRNIYGKERINRWELYVRTDTRLNICKEHTIYHTVTPSQNLITIFDWAGCADVLFILIKQAHSRAVVRRER